MTNVVTPVKADTLDKLLRETHYDDEKRRFLVNGFKRGFSIKYQGPKNVRIKSPNLKFAVGDEVDLWNKIMKEVKLKRFAGPFLEKDIPFRHYIQSPVGLVPKDNGTDVRLIFHLSYPRNGKGNKKSVNANTPAEFCKVSYPDFAKAVQLCMKAGPKCHLGRSDMRSAFRNLGVMRKYWKYLLLKAKSPIDGKWYFFVDKAIPFGHSISCKLFQEFSNSIAHIVKFKTQADLVNYLDDYLFIALFKLWCDKYLRTFLTICKQINFPVSMEKTFWGATQMTFLGFLINSVTQSVSIPQEKITKARNMILYILNKKQPGKQLKVKVFELQRICGFLNFIGRAIVPGRAFTRRMYSFFNSSMKSHYHVRVNAELKSDLEMWLRFIEHPSIFSRPFLDYSEKLMAEEILFYTDASKHGLRGFGGFCNKSWMSASWGNNFIRICNPSIEFLELYALTAGILAWIHRFKNHRVVIFVDNTGVKHMINNNSSGCKRCMVLIRIIVLHCLIHNVRVYAKYVSTKDNEIADSLSRLQTRRFKRLTRHMKMDKLATPVPDLIWPVAKVWFK